VLGAQKYGNNCHNENKPKKKAGHGGKKLMMERVKGVKYIQEIKNKYPIGLLQEGNECKEA